MKISTEFEKTVRIALMHEEMTASDLAKELGITDGYLSDILKGKRDAKSEWTKKICERLDIDESIIGQ